MMVAIQVTVVTVSYANADCDHFLTQIVLLSFQIQYLCKVLADFI